MTEAKLKRLIVAITVGAVLLVVILSIVMATGIIEICAEKNDIAELEREIARYEQMLAEGHDTYELRSTRWWIERRARELGYTFDGSVGLN
jgi:hypothetical protein